MAKGYAFHRPPVHEEIIRAIRGRLPGEAGEAVGRTALDIGCGAGLSTAALGPLAARLVGLEPEAAMLAHCRVVVPGARFVIGRAERLPFRDGAFDVVAAAGSLNYADLELALPEISRVLARAGRLLVYDFSAARRLRDDGRLDEWFAEFARRYPFAPGYAMDIRTAGLDAAGLALASFDPLEVSVPMTLASYLDYAMSETNVEEAIARGADEAGIRDWCRATLLGILGEAPRLVLFDAYAAVIRRA